MLLVEYRVLDKVRVIREGTGVNKKTRIRGPFQKMDEINNNGRIYPGPILEAQVKALQEKINERSLVGALDHPANTEIYLQQASHLITKLWIEGKTVMGEAEILSTPNGKIVEALLNDGVKIGISSRGIGTISEGKNAKVVNDDYKCLTFDLVSDPSTKGAYPELTESVRLNSEKAQKIVSKMRSEQIFLTALKAKLNEARGSDDGYDAKRDRGFASGHSKSDKPFRNPTLDKKPEPKKEEKPKSEPKQKKFNFGESIHAALVEGLVKAANKAKKGEFEAKLGKAVKSNNYNMAGSSRGTKSTGRAVLKHPESPTSKEAVRKVKAQSVKESLQRIVEGTSTKKDKECLKSYLISHLTDLQYTLPWPVSAPTAVGEPYKEKTEEERNQEKIELFRRLLSAINDI